uniref:Uncharacterized protein n=1 Tax=Ananas comosus var. bracteatus TaxID=296719 RepID=A0A6V7PY33_ANACO|nr:unnamed protein product [Ananas comosus var. bracteatus]
MDELWVISGLIVQGPGPLRRSKMYFRCVCRQNPPTERGFGSKLFRRAPGDSWYQSVPSGIVRGSRQSLGAITGFPAYYDDRFGKPILVGLFMGRVSGLLSSLRPFTQTISLRQPLSPFSSPSVPSSRPFHGEAHLFFVVLLPNPPRQNPSSPSSLRRGENEIRPSTSPKSVSEPPGSARFSKQGERPPPIVAASSPPDRHDCAAPSAKKKGDLADSPCARLSSERDLASLFFRKVTSTAIVGVLMILITLTIQPILAPPAYASFLSATKTAENLSAQSY